MSLTGHYSKCAPIFYAAGLFERGCPEQAVQEGHAAQNVVLGIEKNKKPLLQ